MLDLIITEVLETEQTDRCTFDDILSMAGIEDVIYQDSYSLIVTCPEGIIPSIVLNHKKSDYSGVYLSFDNYIARNRNLKRLKRATSIFISHIPVGYNEFYNKFIKFGIRKEHLDSLLKTLLQDRPIIQQINNRSFFLKIEKVEIRKQYVSITIKHFIKNKLYKIPRDFTPFYFQILEELQEVCEILKNIKI